MNPVKFSFHKRIQSFRFAFSGLWFVLKYEHNFRIHLLAAVVAVLAGFYFDISGNEWLAIILIIALVLTLEMVNSAIEKLADVVSPEKNEKIKVVKDISAAVVLLAAMAALVVAALIFIPKMGL